MKRKRRNSLFSSSTQTQEAMDINAAEIKGNCFDDTEADQLEIKMVDAPSVPRNFCSGLFRFMLRNQFDIHF